MGKTANGKAPKEGSRAWEAQLHTSPTYIRNTIKSLADRAAKGSRADADALDKWLARHPGMRAVVPQLADLCSTAEGAWVRALAGADLVREKAIREEVAEMKKDLLPASPSVMDRVMVSNVVVSYLANQRAVLVAAKSAEQPAASAARDKRSESAARRLVLALKALDLVRQMKARAAAPKRKCRLFEPAA